MAKRLGALKPDEVSLVPKAANRRRFLLTKGEDMDEIKALQAIEAIDKAGLGDAIEALEGDDPAITATLLAKSDLDEAAKLKLRAAARVLGNDLATSLLVKAAPPEMATCKKCGLKMAKGAKFCADCGKAFDDNSDPEDALDGGSDEGDEAGKKLKGKKMTKSADEIPEAVKALLKKAEDESADLRAQLAKADDERKRLEAEKRRERFIKMAGELKHLPQVVADDFAAVMDKTEGALGEKDFGKLLTVLKAADAIASDSTLFQEFGSGQPGEVRSAQEQVNAKAEELRKADPSLSPERARAKVYKAHPELYRAIAVETEAATKKARG